MDNQPIDLSTVMGEKPQRDASLGLATRESLSGPGRRVVFGSESTNPSSQRQLAPMMVEMLGTVVVDVEDAHHRLEVWVPAGREVHREAQVCVGLGGEVAL